MYHYVTNEKYRKYQLEFIKTASRCYFFSGIILNIDQFRLTEYHLNLVTPQYCLTEYPSELPRVT